MTHKPVSGLAGNVTAIVLGNNIAVGAGPIGRDLLALYYGQAYAVPGKTE